MNFIKKNIIFSIVAAITLIASVYLIFMDLITHGAISQANEKTQESKNKFEAAYRSGNRPVDQNILRIQKDSEELKKLTVDLQRIFGKPYRKALQGFAKKLNFTEDQLYARMKTLFDTAEKGDTTAAKLVPKLFDSLARDMMARDAKGGAKIDEKTPTDPKYLQQVQEAYRGFVTEVGKETVEDISIAPPEEKISSGYYFLAAALGLPRVMDNSQARSYLKDLQAKFTTRRLIPGVTLESKVQDFTYNAYDKTPPPPDAVPDILSTMPIFEDIFNRMYNSKLTRVEQFKRTGFPTKVAGDHYECYSFETKVVGTQDSVRAFVNSLLGAYEQNRVYVVTWVRLSSPKSTAEVEAVRSTLMGADQQQNNDQMDEFPNRRRPLRRGNRPPRPTAARRARQKQISEFDAESQPDYGATVIGAASEVIADVKFKYYKYIGDRLRK